MVKGILLTKERPSRAIDCTSGARSKAMNWVIEPRHHRTYLSSDDKIGYKRSWGIEACFT
ncbi:hypothetical protein [Mesorhizobium sp.]|uniref:hypothetical protein n=1 Tax=Mesorhizobium sp. TaxID=1871066 RepID=UPI0025D08561|nr:hypothetical protein [Mesorhizobium sp.]